MAQGEQQKAKLLYLMRILSEETDDSHGLTLKQITEKLNAYGITADRKTLYNDFELLRTFGIDIINEQKGRDYLYHVGSREFELPELKLLVDSVQSAKFLSVRKSNDLIKKIESLGSRYDAKHLQRQVLISDRVKTMNESVYYSVDLLHEAINTNRQVRFHYFQWNTKKEMELRKNGAWYQISPWGLMWDDENYYLVAFDAEDEKIKHYRVDKMLHLQIVNEDRKGNEQFQQFNPAKYSKSLFGMYGGETVEVTVEGRKEFAGIVIDRFGKDVLIRKKDEDHFIAHITVALSRPFFGWMFSVGDGLKIIAPESVVCRMKEELDRVRNLYENGKEDQE
ncbi:MAG: WYL domain-containing protein [Clostridia bacterium]|nr:WYL domain-containing protein [Clostridia bacterium]